MGKWGLIVEAASISREQNLREYRSCGCLFLTCSFIKAKHVSISITCSPERLLLKLSSWLTGHWSKKKSKFVKLTLILKHTHKKKINFFLHNFVHCCKELPTGCWHRQETWTESNLSVARVCCQGNGPRHIAGWGAGCRFAGFDPCFYLSLTEFLLVKWVYFLVVEEFVKAWAKK